MACKWNSVQVQFWLRPSESKTKECFTCQLTDKPVFGRSTKPTPRRPKITTRAVIRLLKDGDRSGIGVNTFGRGSSDRIRGSDSFWYVLAMVIRYYAFSKKEDRQSMSWKEKIVNLRDPKEIGAIYPWSYSTNVTYHCNRWMLKNPIRIWVTNPDVNVL